jgi:hypothetical protein
MFAVPTQTVSVLAATRLYVLLYKESGNGSTQKSGSSLIPTSPTTPISARYTSRPGSYIGFPRFARRHQTGAHDRNETVSDVFFESKTTIYDDEATNRSVPLPQAGGLQYNTKTSSRTRGGSEMVDLEKQARPSSDSDGFPFGKVLTRKQSSIHINQTRTIASEPMPAHLRVPHFLSQNDLRGSAQSRPQSVIEEYPHLYSTNRHDQENGRAL